MKKTLSLAAFLGVLFLLVFSFCAPQEMAANQNPLTDIPDRLKQQGVPVIRVIPVDQQSPTHIEIDLQSESTDENITFDDNWFILLARREATLAYRRSARLDSFKIIVYNKNGAEIYGTQTFLYPQDISQNLKAVQSKMDNSKTRDILLNDIKLENLTLMKFEVGSDVSEGNGGQIITLFVSGKDLDTINQSLPAFWGSWSAMLETANSKYGTNIALCHLRIMDDKEAILVDEMRDIEIGFTQLKQVKGVKSMHTSPAGDEENSPQMNYSYPPPEAASGSREKIQPHDPDFGDNWMLVTQPASNSDQTITTLALLLSSRKTAIVGYTTGKNTSLIERSDIMIEMDDGKGVSKLVSKVHVASIDHLDFWAWVFEPRKPGANQLTVIIQTGDDPSTAIKVPIAQFIGGPDSADERISRRIDAPCPQAFDEDGLRISFEGWYLPPLPAQPSPTATLPDGVSIDHKFSLRIENTSSKEAQFLYIQFYSNGDILGEVIH